MPMPAAVAVICRTGRRARSASSHPPAPAASSTSGPVSSNVAMSRVTASSAFSVLVPTRMSRSLLALRGTTSSRNRSSPCRIMTTWGVEDDSASVSDSLGASALDAAGPPSNSSTLPDRDRSCATVSCRGTFVRVESLTSRNSPPCGDASATDIWDAREARSRSMPA